jgi:hypothetical protein
MARHWCVNFALDYALRLKISAAICNRFIDPILSLLLPAASMVLTPGIGLLLRPLHASEERSCPFRSGAKIEKHSPAARLPQSHPSDTSITTIGSSTQY